MISMSSRYVINVRHFVHTQSEKGKEKGCCFGKFGYVTKFVYRNDEFLLLYLDELSKERHTAKLHDHGLQAFDPYAEDGFWKDDDGNWSLVPYA